MKPKAIFFTCSFFLGDIHLYVHVMLLYHLLSGHEKAFDFERNRGRDRERKKERETEKKSKVDLEDTKYYFLVGESIL